MPPSDCPAMIYGGPTRGLEPACRSSAMESSVSVPSGAGSLQPDPGPVHDADRGLRRRGPLNANPFEHVAAQGRDYDDGWRSLAHGQQVDAAAADVGQRPGGGKRRRSVASAVR